MWAFPFTFSDGENCGGMLLRDYFAARALQGLLASGLRPHDEPNESGELYIARMAYKFADALIKARD